MGSIAKKRAIDKIICFHSRTVLLILKCHLIKGKQRRVERRVAF